MRAAKNIVNLPPDLNFRSCTLIRTEIVMKNESNHRAWRIRGGHNALFKKSNYVGKWK